MTYLCSLLSKYHTQEDEKWSVLITYIRCEYENKQENESVRGRHAPWGPQLLKNTKKKAPLSYASLKTNPFR